MNKKKIPVNSLDQIACIHIGKKNELSAFDHIAPEIKKINFFIDKDASDNKWDTLRDNIRNFKTIIVSLYGLTKFVSSHNGISEETLEFLNQLRSNSKDVILVIFGSAYSLSTLKHFDHIIMAYEEEYAAQLAAAQVLFGLTKAKGKLPIII